VNPLKRRTSSYGRSVAVALATGGIAASVVLSGCGAGQVSQTATQEPAVNGTSGGAGDIALRNVHLRANQTADYVQPGSDAELIFVAANTSADVADKLVRITSDIGTVSLQGDAEIPVNGSLVVGVPDGQIAPLESVEPVDATEATVKLSKPITNGLTYDFTFTFEKAGDTTVPVPISAGESPRRGAGAESGGSGGHSGGH
jgi:copper(I)-binding protein